MPQLHLYSVIILPSKKTHTTPYIDAAYVIRQPQQLR